MQEITESIQLINTAIIKSKERKIDSSYDRRLKEIFQGPVVEALNKSIVHLSESQKISRDQAATMMIETIRDLDKVWSDYVMMEGITKLKEFLQSQENSTPKQ